MTETSTQSYGPGAYDAVTIENRHGDVEAEVEFTSRSSSPNRVQGRLGDGAPTLSCSSGNGDVRLYTLES